MRTLAILTFHEAAISVLVIMAIACFIIAYFIRRTPKDDDPTDF